MSYSSHRSPIAGCGRSSGRTLKPAESLTPRRCVHIMQGADAPTKLLGSPGVGKDEDGWLLSLLESCRRTDKEVIVQPEEDSETIEDSLGAGEAGATMSEENGVSEIAAVMDPG